MHVRVLLSRYRTYTPCPDCRGQRFQSESLLHKIHSPDNSFLTLSEFYRLPINQALGLIDIISSARVGASEGRVWSPGFSR